MKTTLRECRHPAFKAALLPAFALLSFLIVGGATALVATPPVFAACSAEVTVDVSFERAYYEVSGRTGAELIAQLKESPLRDASGEAATGRAEYHRRLTGTKCVEPGACSIGQMTIERKGTVTLPRLASGIVLEDSLQRAWDRFVQAVTLHEERHVAIAVEGVQELRHELLQLGVAPTCEALDHQIDRVWRLTGEATERRQAAFHTADSQGRGGLVVQ